MPASSRLAMPSSPHDLSPSVHAMRVLRTGTSVENTSSMAIDVERIDTVCVVLRLLKDALGSPGAMTVCTCGALSASTFSVPVTSTTSLPGLQIPAPTAYSSAASVAAVSPANSHGASSLKGYRPYVVLVWRHTCSEEVATRMGQLGRYFAASFAAEPLSENTRMRPGSMSMEFFTAEATTASMVPIGLGVKSRMKLNIA
mmetsp:Transcript_2138/g.7435  ORF Transcript_2138/g.7435 Transcript_2138/m.7435 type:complete len:200 (+) Transcript_2138:1501-2100(+)